MHILLEVKRWKEQRKKTDREDAHTLHRIEPSKRQASAIISAIRISLYTYIIHQNTKKSTLKGEINAKQGWSLFGRLFIL